MFILYIILIIDAMLEGNAKGHLQIRNKGNEHTVGRMGLINHITPFDLYNPWYLNNNNKFKFFDNTYY